jgi:hypothetical protein
MFSLRELTDKLNELSIVEDEEVLVEDKGHLDHPEDLIFLGGSAGATKAVNAIVDTVKNPKNVTIKWDGYPALIFGRDVEGKFSIMDKHMFNKKDGSGRVAYSPQAFRKYDLARGVDRSDLHRLIAMIWPGLEKEAQGKGYYWGDLLFSNPLQNDNGLYKFKANPNGITYTVDVNSDVGKLLTSKQAGIAVHQYIDPSAPTTDQAVPLNGTIGQLRNDSNVAIVPSKMPLTPKLTLSQAQVARCQQAIQKYGPAVDKMLSTAPQARSGFVGLFTVYINRKVVSRNLTGLMKDFMAFFNTRPMTESMKAKLTEHFRQNREGLAGAFVIWSEIYKLKMSVVKQLDKASKASPVKGYLQDGSETHEGFVAYGLKFVDRMGFSAQNLAARAPATP